MTKLSPTAAISFGWEAFKKGKKFWIIVAILAFSLGSSGGGGGGGSSYSGSEDDYAPINNQQENIYQQENLEYLQDGTVMQKESSVPFIPEKIDNVLGVSDQRDKGNMGIFVALVGLFVIISIPFIVVSILISGAVQMGVLKLYITAARGKVPSYEIILSEVDLRKSFKFLAGTFLYVLVVIGGLILFVIPGIYFAMKYSFVSYNIVDKNTGIREAFKLSGQHTKGNKWNLFMLSILVVIVNIGGLLALFYGLLVTIPVTSIAAAYAYDRLSK